MSVNVHFKHYGHDRIELPSGEFCYSTYQIIMTGFDPANAPVYEGTTGSGYTLVNDPPWVSIDKINGVTPGAQGLYYTYWEDAAGSSGTSEVKIGAINGPAVSGIRYIYFNSANLGAKGMQAGFNLGNQHATSSDDAEYLSMGITYYPIRPVGSNQARVRIYESKSGYDGGANPTQQFNVLF